MSDEPTISDLVGKLSAKGIHKRQKMQARGEAQQFLQKYKINRPSCPCGARRTQMHHPDYAEPLRVMFLCSTCHGDEHRAEGFIWKYRRVVDLHDLIPESMKRKNSFTPENISEIRSKYQADPKPDTIQKLATIWQVSENTIRVIVSLRDWRA